MRNELEIARTLLKNAGKPDNGEAKEIAADGSTRRFWRFTDTIVAAPPVSPEARNMREAAATWHIGSHLHGKGCATPEIYGYDTKSGVLAMEDVGSTTLYDVCQNVDNNRRLPLYKNVIRKLIFMQVHGAENFQEKWCWDCSCYDAEMMLARESNYFLSAYWQGILHQPEPEGIAAELYQLARRAGEAPALFFQHRDCQSRNIIIRDDSAYFIDFQGGLFGALGYDLASLLIDPYIGLSCSLQEELLLYYVDTLSEMTRKVVDVKQFRFWYNDLALQRNLQIIGAFSFLSTVKKKQFFAQYIKPSVIMLEERLQLEQFTIFPIIRKTAIASRKSLSSF